LQFSATLVNLAQIGKIFTKIRHIRWTCPKWANTFTTIVGQSDWLRHCYWFSCLTYSQSRRHRGDLVG